MEEKKTLIIFLDDDDKKKTDWVVIKEKTTNYISFEYKRKILTLPWQRILKVKEDVND